MGNQQSSAGGGIVSPSGGLYLAGSQINLVSDNDTKVELATVISGFTDGIEDTVNHRILPGEAGLYLIIAKLTLYNMVADKHYRLNVKISGSAKGTDYKHASFNQLLGLEVTLLYWLSAANYVELWATSYAGVDTVDVKNQAYNTYLQVQRVR